MLRFFAILLVLAIILPLSISGTLAKSEKTQAQGKPTEKTEKAEKVETKTKQQEEVSTKSARGAAKKVATSSARPQATCDPTLEWKNHGAYVSCIAKLKLGGQTVSEAARSDVGKKGSTPSADEPTASSSATPSATLVATSSAEQLLSLPTRITIEVNNLTKNLMNFLRKLKIPFSLSN